MKNRTIILILAIVFFAFQGNGLAETHQRDSWYIGFGLGGAFDASYEIDGQENTFDDWLEFWGFDKDPKISLNFKVGKTLSPKNLLGFDITAVSQTGSIPGGDGHIQISNFFLMFTHFPKEEGFFIRAGGGLSTLTAELDWGFGDVSDSASGFGLLGGIGYAFWLGKSFNLTLNIDHSRQFYSGGNDPDNSQFTIFYLGFDWY